jgi:hypothetical protein
MLHMQHELVHTIDRVHRQGQGEGRFVSTPGTQRGKLRTNAGSVRRNLSRRLAAPKRSDGGNVLTHTPLDDVVRVIERQSGTLAVNEIVHCFQDSNEISAAGRIIRKQEASRIQESPDVKVVLFKRALSTGWDCPRAEVMMSFRRAQDSLWIF